MARRRETIITREDIHKFCKILDEIAKHPDLVEEAIKRNQSIVLVEVKILLGGGVWWTDPPKPKLISGSTVVFRNESTKYDIRMEFKTDRVTPKKFEIPAKGKKKVRVKGSGKEKVKVDLRSRRKGTSGAWTKRDGTGNGADMELVDP